MAVRNSGMDNIFWIRIRNGCGAHMSRGGRGDREARVVRVAPRGLVAEMLIFWSRMRRWGTLAQRVREREEVTRIDHTHT